MIYQLTAVLFSHNSDALNDVWNKILDAWPDLEVIKPGLPDQQCSVAERIDCNHDQTPPTPCIVTEHIDNCPLAP